MCECGWLCNFTLWLMAFDPMRSSSGPLRPQEQLEVGVGNGWRDERHLPLLPVYRRKPSYTSAESIDLLSMNVSIDASLNSQCFECFWYQRPCRRHQSTTVSVTGALTLDCCLLSFLSQRFGTLWKRRSTLNLTACFGLNHIEI